jgi:hypothetical protein
LIFELRNGPGIPSKSIDKIHGEWREVRPNERLVLKEHGQRLDAERLRKREVILQVLFDEAFEGQGGLGEFRTILERLSVLSSKGCIKYFRNAEDYGPPALARSKYGYLCVEDMVLRRSCGGAPDPDTSELPVTEIPVKPTHYKSPQTGTLLPVENPDCWIYQEEFEP